jgi:hypothetical protein
LALIFAEAASGSELRTRMGIQTHKSDLSGWKALGGGQPGVT